MSKGIVLFLEGETEIEFYTQLIDRLHSYCLKFSVEAVIPKNLKGIGNYKSRAKRVFTKEIKPKYPDMDFVIILCYDTDVFEFSAKPPIRWNEVEKDLKEAGAIDIIHIKAKSSIEDWFLVDEVGVKKFLRISQKEKSSKSRGVEKLQDLFKKAKRVYIKGSKVDGFIEKLSMEKIMKQICKEINPLCNQLGVKCNGKKCGSNSQDKNK